MGAEACGARSGSRGNGRPSRLSVNPSRLRVNTNGGCPSWTAYCADFSYAPHSSNSSLTYDANPDLCEHNASLCGSGGWEGHSQNGKLRFLGLVFRLNEQSQNPRPSHFEECGTLRKLSVQSEGLATRPNAFRSDSERYYG